MTTPQVSTNSFAEPDDLATPMVSISDINFSTQTPSLSDATPLVCNGTISNGSLPNFITDNSISYEDMPRTIAAPPTADYQEFAASNETPIQYSAALWRNQLYRSRVKRSAKFKQIHSSMFPSLTANQMVFVYYHFFTDNIKHVDMDSWDAPQDVKDLVQTRIAQTFIADH